METRNRPRPLHEPSGAFSDVATVTPAADVLATPRKLAPAAPARPDGRLERYREWLRQAVRRRGTAG